MIYNKSHVILSCDKVCVKLGGRQILNNVTFQVKDIVRPDMHQGQVVSLIARSGIGKSTLFNALAGLYSLDNSNSGSILIGKELKPVKVGDMGVVYQNYYIYPHRTLMKILKMAVESNKDIQPADRVSAVRNVIERFNLLSELEKFPVDFSGGQRQRAAIAEQILLGGEFLLLDEPFSGLDVLMIKEVVDLIIKVSCTSELKTIFIVSHDLPNSVAISDTVFVMNYLDKDPSKGATIIKEIDLIERNLAWRPDIKQTSAFKETISEIEDLL